MPHINITCPHCAKDNNITVSQVPEPMEIYCSNCHAPLGTWSKLERESKRANSSAVNGNYAS
jgi:RNase P subunit RPR2